MEKKEITNKNNMKNKEITTKNSRTNIFWKNLADKVIIKPHEDDEEEEVHLPSDASSKEIKQYILQKLITTYLQTNLYLSWEKTCKKLGVSKSQLFDIYRGKISDFSLQEINSCVKKLIPEKELWIEMKEVIRKRA